MRGLPNDPDGGRAKESGYFEATTMSGHGELLAESASANASTFKLVVTQDEIATRLGTERELVSRSLGRLRAAGVVEVAGRRVTIRDVRRLSAIADGQTLVARVIGKVTRRLTP